MFKNAYTIILQRFIDKNFYFMPIETIHLIFDYLENNDVVPYYLNNKNIVRPNFFNLNRVLNFQFNNPPINQFIGIDFNKYKNKYNVLDYIYYQEFHITPYFHYWCSLYSSQVIDYNKFIFKFKNKFFLHLNGVCLQLNNTIWTTNHDSFHNEMVLIFTPKIL